MICGGGEGKTRKRGAVEALEARRRVLEKGKGFNGSR